MLVVLSLGDQLVLDHFCIFSLMIFFIISMISLVDMMQNDSMSFSVTVSLAYGFVSWSSPSSMLACIVLILSTMNSLDSFANCSFDILGGNRSPFFSLTGHCKCHK